MKKYYVIGLCLILIPASLSVLHGQYVDLLLARIAHYPFTQDARDISGYDNHGLAVGAVLTADTPDGTGYACAFDGLDDRIYCGEGMPAISSVLTVACWVRTEDGEGLSHVVSKYDPESGGGFVLGLQEGVARWTGKTGKGTYVRITSSSRIDDNRWHLLIGMVDGRYWTLYVDGIAENHADTGPGTNDLSGSAPLTLGYYHHGDEGDHRFYKGILDNVLIYGRVLNDCELETLYDGLMLQPR
jgi:hypothetical protein